MSRSESSSDGLAAAEETRASDSGNGAVGWARSSLSGAEGGLGVAAGEETGGPMGGIHPPGSVEWVGFSCQGWTGDA